MTLQQIVRDILERAVEGGLATFAEPEQRDDPDPRQLADEDVQPCANLLKTWLPYVKPPQSGG